MCCRQLRGLASLPAISLGQDLKKCSHSTPNVTISSHDNGSVYLPIRLQNTAMGLPARYYTISCNGYGFSV